MNIKDTIKALLQSKFGGVQLSATRIEAIAKRLEGKVTIEEELLQKLEALNELQPFSEMRAEDDRARSAQAEIEKLKKAAGKSDEKDKGEGGTGGSGTAAEGAGGEEIPEWAKALIDGNKALTETVQALKGEKVVTDRRASILAKLDGADKEYSDNVLEYFGYMNFADDEAFNKYLDKVGSDFTAHKQTTAESKLGNDAPFLGVGNAKLKDEEVSPLMQGYLKAKETTKE